MIELESYEYDTEPFTMSELKSVHVYEAAVNNGIRDCFYGMDIEYVRQHETQFGQEMTQAMLREHAGMLNTWYLAIESLLSDILTCAVEYTRYSIAASRYVKAAAADYHRTRQEFEHMVTVWSLALLTNDVNEDYPPPTRTVNMMMQTLSTED